VALRALGVSTSSIRQGFAQVCSLTGLRGRWEILCQKPLTICDTGHNSHGLRYVVQQLLSPSRPFALHFVFGMVNDKDVDVVLSFLPKEAHYYWTQAQTHRAIPAVQLGEMAKRLNGLKGECYPTVEAAVRAAQQEANEQDVIFIGGSNYVVGEALLMFQKKE